VTLELRSCRLLAAVSKGDPQKWGEGLKDMATVHRIERGSGVRGMLEGRKRT
jgi:hypothetical protein